MFILDENHFRAIIGSALAILVTLIITTICPIHPALAASAYEVEKNLSFPAGRDELVFISQTSYPPFEFLDRNEKPAGMSVDLVRWLGMVLAFNPRFIHAPFQAAQEAVLQGKADVITSLFYSEKRSQNFAFTDTIFKVPAFIFVRADRPDIARLADLAGKRLAMQAGDYAAEFLESKGVRVELVLTGNFDQATDLVIGGKADAVIGDEQIVLYYLFKNNLTNLVKKVGDPLYIGQCCMAVKAGNTALQGALNRGIKLARERGVLDNINERWLGSQIQAAPSPLTRYLPHILAAAGLLVLAALAIWLWNIRLRQMVDKRTRELAEQKAVVASILNALPVLIFLKNKELQYITANRALLDFLRMSEDELYGKTDLDIFPPHQAELFRAMDRDVMQTGTPIINIEEQVRGADGTDCWMLTNKVPYRGLDNRIAGMVGAAMDIGLRKKAEQNAQESEEKYRHLLSYLPDPVVVYDALGQVTFVNQAFKETYGWTLEELNQGQADFVPLEEAEPTQEAWQRTLAGERFLFDTRRHAREGQLLHVQIRTAVLRDSEGAYQGSIVIHRNLTERRRAEEERARLEAQLQQAQKMEALGTLAGGVAHEFNNLLMAIRGYTQLIYLGHKLDGKVTQVLHKIDDSAKRAADLTSRMLTFSRMETGDKSAVDLNRILSGVEELVRSTFPRRISLEMDLAPAMPLVEANPNQLEQVVLNLAVNARDAMPQGGTLRIATGLRPAAGLAGPMNGSPPPGGEQAVITISDTGTGMPLQVAERMFEPFFTTKAPGKGTGLGLSVAYSIIKSHGGTFEVESVPGQGTTIRVILPVSAASKGEISGEPVREAAPDGWGRRILIVDDERSMREISRESLESYGYRVSEASQGEEALEIFKAAQDQGDPFDLVIMDLSMPIMDGRECFRRMTALSPSAKVIIATGQGGDLEIPDCRGARPVSIIRKPFDLRGLLAEVGRALG